AAPLRTAAAPPRRAASPPGSHARPRIRLAGAVVLAAAGMVPAVTAAAAASAAPPSAAGAALAPGAAGSAGPAAAAAAICDSTAALTVIGMDTASGMLLFAVGGPGGGAGSWIVALETGAANSAGSAGSAAAAPAPSARAYPERQGGRFGGSVGPGPVLALQSCGPDCLQAVRFEHGDWSPLGEPLSVPSASTVAATYDASGAPWLVAHAAANQEGLVQAFSFRYEGRAWKSCGGLAVTAVSQPQAVPAPQRRDGVITGTGLFSASGPPATWVQGLPGVAPARRGQLLALPGAGAAYLSADGVAYLSADSGKTWRRSTWTPWGGGETTGMWRQGTDYGIDLPFGDHRGELRLVWFDRRSPAAERMVLTRLGPGGAWTELAAAPTDVTTRNGDHLPVNQVLIPRGDSWLLLSGCAATAAGSGLVLRTFENNQLSEPRFVPIAVEPKAPAGGKAPAEPRSPAGGEAPAEAKPPAETPLRR
ncbi:MAG TPA: DUF1388 domain-containing protein, partial [Thermoanaerobaculia bacterium]|nr:DUF1388 domain-containing protein [Thermoanaerobaculia bacterium]